MILYLHLTEEEETRAQIEGVAAQDWHQATCLFFSRALGAPRQASPQIPLHSHSPPAPFLSLFPPPSTPCPWPEVVTDPSCLFQQCPGAQVIDTQRCLACDQIFLCWRLLPHSPPAWHYTIEFRRTDVPAQPGHRWRREEVKECQRPAGEPPTRALCTCCVSAAATRPATASTARTCICTLHPGAGEWALGAWDPGTDSCCWAGPIETA